MTRHLLTHHLNGFKIYIYQEIQTKIWHMKNHDGLYHCKHYSISICMENFFLYYDRQTGNKIQ